ncbi:hypothetical protein [Alicyclobacillus fodiniaquatilis]|uniref:Uncharacterized protein n=1 Tax=Alicyclobacillus fodiniaquatilis TaxID=1661150 RepID=A0ABW4JHG5_9BACL
MSFQHVKAILDVFDKREKEYIEIISNNSTEKSWWAQMCLQEEEETLFSTVGFFMGINVNHLTHGMCTLLSISRDIHTKQWLFIFQDMRGCVWAEHDMYSAS